MLDFIFHLAPKHFSKRILLSWNCQGFDVVISIIAYRYFIIMLTPIGLSILTHGVISLKYATLR